MGKSRQTQNRSAPSTVLFVSHALERTARALLFHKAPGVGVALHEITIRGLKLRAVVHRAAPEPITGILRHRRYSHLLEIFDMGMNRLATRGASLLWKKINGFLISG